MSIDRVPMTREGYDKLKADLERMQIEMIEITKRVATAREMGDLSENAEYHAAREDQGMLQARMDQKKDQLARAFIVDRSVRAGDIVRSAQAADRRLITDVTVFDVYEGKGIEDGKKSIAIAVTIQPREKTLTDQEIDAVAARIVADVTKKTGGALRA